jgi:hypothetical protein
MSDRNDLPQPSAANFNQRLRETIQTYLGRQGDPLDRGLTLRDLLDAGVVRLKAGFSARPGQVGGSLPLAPVVIEDEPDLTPPPQPSGFTVSAAISHVFIEHAAPTYTQGHGHLRTHVYGVTVTAGQALPAAHVIHTVGPIGVQPRALASCYRRSLEVRTRTHARAHTPALT